MTLGLVGTDVKLKAVNVTRTVVSRRTRKEVVVVEERRGVSVWSRSLRDDARTFMSNPHWSAPVVYRCTEVHVSARRCA